MKRRALDVLGENGAPARANDTTHRGELGQALLLHQQFQGAETAVASWHLEHAGLLAITIDDGNDAKALDKAATGDRGSQFFDRDASPYPSDIRLAQHQLVEGNVMRGRQGDLLNCSNHVEVLRDERSRVSLSTLQPVIPSARSRHPTGSAH